MKPAEQRITRFLRTRWFTFSVIAIALLTAFFPEHNTPVSLTVSDHGILFPSPYLWTSDLSFSRWLALAVNMSVVFLMVYLNRRFNMMRTMNLLFVAMFMLMESATPSTLMCFSGGQLAALVIMSCLGAMYSVYNAPVLIKRVFLVFCALSACSLIQAGFPVYIAVFIIGSAQMRIFSLRTLAAAILGIITPLWIVLGLGFASFSGFHLPQLVNPFSSLPIQVSLQLFVTVGVTLLTGLVTGTANLLRIISLNARTRAYSSLLALIGIVTGLMAMLDFTNIEFYIPLLNACTAFQLGYFFRFNASRRAYLPVLILIAAYISLWIWKILI